jgi:hypothetical protein
MLTMLSNKHFTLFNQVTALGDPVHFKLNNKSYGKKKKLHHREVLKRKSWI